MFEISIKILLLVSMNRDKIMFNIISLIADLCLYLPVIGCNFVLDAVFTKAFTKNEPGRTIWPS